MGRISESVIEKIREETDIVEIASGYISLKKAGRNYKALCPFHAEKTPSFIVSPDKQIFRCFGCGVGGNVFHLVMKMENMSFIESVKFLGQKIGIPVVLSKEEEGDAKKKEAILEANEKASRIYHACLYREEYKKAKEYLEKRGLKEETISKFRIGYAPGGNFLIQEIKRMGVSINILREAGLVASGELQGQGHDYFRKRIIFPIFDLHNNVIGFGGRVLDEEEPKYLNTAETQVFSKGRVLYGLNFTKEGIRKTGEAIIVEGYMDFIALYEQGIENVVASLGTALTDSQISLLRRYTEKPIICYDADAAGEAATLRGLDLLIEREIEPRILVLPSGDPDSFVREKGRDGFLKMVKNALPLMDYHFKRLFSKYNPDTEEGKHKISSEMLPIIGKIKNEVQKSLYLKRLAEELDLVERRLYGEYERMLEKYARMPFSRKGMQEGTEFAGTGRADAILLRLILEDNRYIPYVRDNLQPGDFSSAEYQKIAEAILRMYEKHKKVDFRSLMDNLNDESLIGIASRFSLEEDYGLDELSADESKERMVRDCVRRIREASLVRKKREIEKEIKKIEKEGSASKLSELLVQYQELEKFLRNEVGEFK